MRLNTITRVLLSCICANDSLNGKRVATPRLRKTCNWLHTTAPSAEVIGRNCFGNTTEKLRKRSSAEYFDHTGSESAVCPETPAVTASAEFLHLTGALDATLRQLQPTQHPCGRSETVSLDTHALQHGDEEIGQGIVVNPVEFKVLPLPEPAACN
ncbi:MAG: hypothetical protein ACI9R3_003256 [Verrucomicrobiales bacterium]|jgi:hypothetical protein